ncbi:GGDEF domain-containing protein [Aquabacter sp. CN5-332]
MHLSNFLLLFADMAVYFGLMLALFRARTVIGIGGLFCALGVMHLTTVYLSSSFFFVMPFGLGLSPGSLVLYAGCMSMLLLVYIREGLFAARQPVYGLLLGSFLLTIIAALLGFEHARFPFQRPADISFLNQMSALMLWGTLLLFIECAFIFRLFEWFMRRSGRRLWLSAWLTLAITCTFDQLLFFPALHFAFGVPLAVGLGGWIGKVLATGFYAALLVFYLRHVEGVPMRPGRAAMRFSEVSLRHDPVTGAFHRARFDQLALDLVSVSVSTGRPLTLMLVDVDPPSACGSQADRAGQVLRLVAQAISEGLRAGDYVVRFDGNALAVLAPGLPHQAAVQVASMMRQRIEGISELPDGIAPPDVAIGIATTPMDGESVASLLSAADNRVYAAKTLERGRVVGAFEA